MPTRGCLDKSVRLIGPRACCWALMACTTTILHAAWSASMRRQSTQFIESRQASSNDMKQVQRHTHRTRPTTIDIMYIHKIDR